MPTLADFLGIKITMYWEKETPHKGPHFHAKYGDYKAVFRLNGDPVSGRFPKRQTAFVKAWALLHEEELKEAWEKAKSNKPITKKIKGLS